MTAFYLISHLQALPSVYYGLCVKQLFSEIGMHIVIKGSQTTVIEQY